MVADGPLRRLFFDRAALAVGQELAAVHTHPHVRARPVGRCVCASVHAGKEAASLEAALGIHVLRHTDKKPAGGAAELAAHFGCPSEQLIMVGDRRVQRPAGMVPDFI